MVTNDPRRDSSLPLFLVECELEVRADPFLPVVAARCQASRNCPTGYPAIECTDRMHIAAAEKPENVMLLPPPSVSVKRPRWFEPVGSRGLGATERCFDLAAVLAFRSEQSMRSGK